MIVKTQASQERTFAPPCSMISRIQLQGVFAVVIPRSRDMTGKIYKSFYVLLRNARPSGIDRIRLEIFLEHELQGNIHYKYARETLRLGPVKVDLSAGPPGIA
jgi:hypothetical protein